MQGGRSFVSSRMFARDERPVPNIVAIYEKPRHKIRRDATHVLGGMFGWNSPEETERALRAEDARAEEAAAAATPTPTTSISPQGVVADSTLSGLSQRCGKRPLKRSKRRALVPLADMGASILSVQLQELMRRQQEPEEKDDQTTVTASVKRSSTIVDDPPVPVDPAPAKKARISVASVDPPATKKLRLTISTGPPADSPSTAAPLQLPLSPPDTSSNASKAPADERLAGPVSSSTPKADLPRLEFADFDLSNLSGAFSLSPLDSSSDSESSSESSSSESSSDSPDLSSSTSTRSTPQEQGKGKGKGDPSNRSTATISRNNTPSAPATSTRGPSTPPKRKRPVHKPGWIGWVQTEESPDHSRLIRLDDAPVILGRRTRSGKEFVDPPVRKRPPPAEKSTVAEKPALAEQPATATAPAPAPAEKPKTDQSQPPRKDKRRPKPSKKSRRTGQKSKQQSAWQEAQKRSAGGRSGSDSDTKGDDKSVLDADNPFADDEDLPLAILFPPSTPTKGKASTSANSKEIASGPAPASPDPIQLPSRSVSSLTATPASGSANPPAPSTSGSPVAVLKLPRSDTVISPTGIQPNEPISEETNKGKDVRKKTSGTAKTTSLGDVAVQPASQDDALAGSDNVARLGTKDTRSKTKETANGPESKSVLGTANNVSTLTGGSKPSAKSSSDGVAKKSSAATNSESKGTSGITENSPTLPKTTSGRVSPIKDGAKWNSDVKPSRSLEKMAPGPAAVTKTPSSNASNAATTTSSSTTSTRPVRPFPMSLSSRSDPKTDSSSKSSPKIPFIALGKRKESSSSLSTNGQSSSQARPKKRKIFLSSSDESETPKFIVNPFDRRAKQMELTRKGMSGERFQAEMQKWMDEKKAEWRVREREEKEKEKEASGGSSDARATTGEASTAAKPKVDNVQQTLTAAAPKPKPKANDPARKLVWNGVWGMDVAKVSPLASAAADKARIPRLRERRESEGGNRRESDVGNLARESNAGRDRRESDTGARGDADRSVRLAKPNKPRVLQA